MTRQRSLESGGGPNFSSPQSAGSVNIDRVSVRLPGRHSSVGRRVVADAMQRVSQNLPAGLAGNFGALKVRVSAHNTTERGLSEAIAESLLRALQRTKP